MNENPSSNTPAPAATPVPAAAPAGNPKRKKALTALALLFALFSVRPSPFCVLDEVDAPLDEANTDRFLAVLKLFLSTTQFIIVTHSRKTIAMGDSLYGVTMEEPGISKIVSVKVRTGEESLPGETPVAAPEETTDTVTA